MQPPTRPAPPPLPSVGPSLSNTGYPSGATASMPSTGPPSGATSAQASRLVAPIPAGGGGMDSTRQMPTPDTAMAPQVREQKARTGVRKPPTRRLQPGDLVCGDCGEGNPPNRKFCSRCGTSLESAEVVKTPWWRKILPKRKAKVLDAGTRPGRAGTRARSRKAAALAKIFPTIRKIVALVLLVGGIVYGVFAPFRGAVNEKVAAGKDKVTGWITPRYDPVHANKVTATGQGRGHEAGRAADGFKNTFWAAPINKGQVVLVMSFPGTVDVDRALITSGVSSNFQSTNRAQKIHLVYNTGATFDVTLKDTPEPQEIKIGNGHDITSVEIHIDSYYRAVRSNDVAVTEVELFKKR
jgi:hypothetical protein